MNTEQTNFEKQTVMIVDNDSDLRALVTLILDGEGLDVVSAGDGQEALDLLTGGAAPDLILTDLNMPGMDGSDFFSKLKDNLKTRYVPVIFISGEYDLEAKIKLIGGEIFLKKPYHLETFTTLIKMHLH